jgi:hypothetical protein
VHYARASTDTHTALLHRSSGPTELKCSTTPCDPWPLKAGSHEVLESVSQDLTPATFFVVNDDLTQTELAQSGDVPKSTNVDEGPVLGPAGLIVSSGDGTL